MAGQRAAASIAQEAVPGVKGREAQPAKSATPVIEWVAAGLGLLLVTGVVIYLLIDGFAARPAFPEIAIEVQSLQRAGDGHVASFKAINRGRENASAVVIEGELRRGGTSIEQSWVTLDYLPSGSERSAGLFFAEDPRRYELVIRARGYVKP